jgi:hypothetical protein
MNLQLTMQKVRLVRRFTDAWWDDFWRRKRRAAEERSPGVVLNASEIDDLEVDEGGALDEHPLIVFIDAQTLFDADRLYRQASRDLATHSSYPDSEIAKARTLAAAQMQRDAKARAIRALERWRERLEAL